VLAAPCFAANATTPQEINAQFPALIRQNLAGFTGSERFSRLTDHEVFKLAQAFSVSDGDPHDLATTISDPVQRARYLKAAEEISPRVVRPRRGGGGGRERVVIPRQKVAAFVPNVGMTLDEIYFGYRTTMVMEAALYSTAHFAGINLSAAWGFGWYTGTAVSYLLQNYAPAADDVIGHTLAVLLDRNDPTFLKVWNALLLSGFSSTYGQGGGGGNNSPPRAPPAPLPMPAVPQPHWTVTPEPAPTPWSDLPPDVRQTICHNVDQDAC
jgi:hypothetical protein